jgi:Arc/MetJ family transcription regulator
MRTNVEIDEKLIRRAMALSGRPTKRAVVEEALHLVVRLKRQEGILKLFGKVQWEGNLDEMRATRFPDWDEGHDKDGEIAHTPAA